MEETRPKGVVLILARQLADHLATPIALVDAEGSLMFYNEAAEELLAQRFGEVGERPLTEWAALWPTESMDGTPFPTAEQPLVIVLQRRVAAHAEMVLNASDGSRRPIGLTCFPLFASESQDDGFEGAVIVFWELARTPG